MANESNITSWVDNSNTHTSILSKIRWFFQKNNNWEQKNKRLTKSFHLTRNDSIVSVIVALAVVWWAIYYGSKVIQDYADINSRADELKMLKSYNNVTPNSDKLSPYVEWNGDLTINLLLSAQDNIEKEIKQTEIIKQEQKNYFEVLLQNIYLPSLNVWKDPYTKNFNMWILWQKYLESDKFQNLYLIQYWSDFAKYVWNDADYNTVDDIVIWSKVVLWDDPRYFYTPITISFSSPNKRSFLLLVNKLSMTSNQNNIALLNEFFSYLLNTIRKDKEEIIQELKQEYWEDFASSSSWDLAPTIWELTEEQDAIYRDRVIWYNLYHRIKGDLTGDNKDLIDDEIIVKTIKDSASCIANNDTDQKCFYNFREKYRNLPYLAYKIWLENQNNRTAGLLEFLQDLPPAIAITSFGFEKYSDSSFLNNKEEEYKWKITFNAYWRNILDSELEEAETLLWKLCFWSSTEQKITPELALSRVEESILSLWRNTEYSNFSSLAELQSLFTDIRNSYGSISNYDKMIKLFEVRRMMNDANLCSK